MEEIRMEKEFTCGYYNGQICVFVKSQDDKITPITFDMTEILGPLIKFTDQHFIPILDGDNLILASFKSKTSILLKDYAMLLSDNRFKEVRKNIKQTLNDHGYVLTKRNWIHELDRELDGLDGSIIRGILKNEKVLALLLAADIFFGVKVGTLGIDDYNQNNAEGKNNSYSDINSEEKGTDNIFDIIDTFGTSAPESGFNFNTSQIMTSIDARQELTLVNKQEKQQSIPTIEQINYTELNHDEERYTENPEEQTKFPSPEKRQQIENNAKIKAWPTNPFNPAVSMPDNGLLEGEKDEGMISKIDSVAENIEIIQSSRKEDVLLEYCNIETKDELYRFADRFLQTISSENRESYNRDDIINFLYDISQVSTEDKIQTVCDYYGISRDQLLVTIAICVAEGFGGGTKYIDPYAVSQTIYNRTLCTECDWIKNSNSIYSQATYPGQFDVYANGMYKTYLNFNLTGSKAALDAIYANITNNVFNLHDKAFFVAPNFPLGGFARLGLDTTTTSFIQGGNVYFHSGTPKVNQKSI